MHKNQENESQNPEPDYDLGTVDTCLGPPDSGALKKLELLIKNIYFTIYTRLNNNKKMFYKHFK